MTTFNYQWVADNFNCGKDITLFIVGVAHLAEVSDIKPLLPESTIHTFECAKIWESTNAKMVDSSGKHLFLDKVYHHQVAVSDHDGTITFHPSDVHMGEPWPWSGSMFPPSQEMKTDNWIWGEPYTVPCISINSFCKTHNTKPDVLHMDVQGAEFLILKHLSQENRPKCMWIEISAFSQYETNTSYKELHDLLISYGYRQEYRNDQDAVYVLKDLTVTPYESNE